MLDLPFPLPLHIQLFLLQAVQETHKLTFWRAHLKTVLARALKSYVSIAVVVTYQEWKSGLNDFVEIIST